ncbi:MAG: bifunctional folylpolyglutamate synthase/dihydrofolate synthase [Verrucomicrobiaceae bacterium]|nr:bifunctional folylpolyglutamate synthase/dihydrofolate synthase [Verrucomicrobiaceae bacterium]
MEYSEAIDWLYGRQAAGIKLGLSNMQRLVGELNLPPAQMKIVHVAGTNGKGSTCAFVESILRAAGEKTGFFSSPHLVSFCERIRIDGVPTDRSEVAAGINALRQLTAQWQPQPTFFEIATALALKIFSLKNIDTAMMEVGLGGRLDSTNVLTPTVCAITPIGMDHQQILGETLGQIAHEKAGILKPGVTAVSAPQPEEAREVLEKRALEEGAPLHFISEPWTESTVSLPGKHQRWNAALAVAALQHGGFKIPEDAIRKGLGKVIWRARFEHIKGSGKADIIVDGAHNAESVGALLHTWHEMFGDTKPVIICAVAGNKNIATMITLLAEIAGHFIFPTIQTLRTTARPEDLTQLVPDSIPSLATATLTEALETARLDNKPILVTGSLFLAGEMLSLLDKSPDQYEPSEQ